MLAALLCAASSSRSGAPPCSATSVSELARTAGRSCANGVGGATFSA